MQSKRTQNNWVHLSLSIKLKTLFHTQRQSSSFLVHFNQFHYSEIDYIWSERPRQRWWRPLFYPMQRKSKRHKRKKKKKKRQKYIMRRSVSDWVAPNRCWNIFWCVSCVIWSLFFSSSSCLHCCCCCCCKKKKAACKQVNFMHGFSRRNFRDVCNFVFYLSALEIVLINREKKKHTHMHQTAIFEYGARKARICNLQN